MFTASVHSLFVIIFYGSWDYTMNLNHIVLALNMFGFNLDGYLD